MNWRTRVSQVTTPLVIAVLLALCIVAFGWMRHGSLWRSFAWLSGSSVLVETSSAKFPAAKEGDRFNLHFNVRNLTTKHIRIVGANVQCSCLRFVNLPMEIPPLHSGTVQATLTALSDIRANSVEYPAEFLFDEPVESVTGNIEVQFAAD